MKKFNLKYAIIVLLAMPVLWFVFKIIGIHPDLLDNFWNDFKWWGLGFVLLFTISIGIYSLVNQKK